MVHRKIDPIKKAEKDFEKRIDAYDYILIAIALLVIGAVFGFYFFSALCTWALPAFVFAILISARPLYDYMK